MSAELLGGQGLRAVRPVREEATAVPERRHLHVLPAGLQRRIRRPDGAERHGAQVQGRREMPGQVVDAGGRLQGRVQESRKEDEGEAVCERLGVLLLRTFPRRRRPGSVATF